MKYILGCLLFLCAIHVGFAQQSYYIDTTGLRLRSIGLCDAQGHPEGMVDVLLVERQRSNVGERVVRGDTLLAVKDSSYTYKFCRRCRRTFRDTPPNFNYVDTVVVRSGETRPVEPGIPSLPGE